MNWTLKVAANLIQRVANLTQTVADQIMILNIKMTLKVRAVAQPVVALRMHIASNKEYEGEIHQTIRNKTISQKYQVIQIQIHNHNLCRKPRLPVRVINVRAPKIQENSRKLGFSSIFPYFTRSKGYSLLYTLLVEAQTNMTGLQHLLSAEQLRYGNGRGQNIKHQKI